MSGVERSSGTLLIVTGMFAVAGWSNMWILAAVATYAKQICGEIASL
jgi:hypothetical protein